MTRGELNSILFIGVSVILGAIIIGAIIYLFKTYLNNMKIDEQLKANQPKDLTEEKKQAFKLDNVSLKFKEVSDEIVIENPINDHNLNFLDDFEKEIEHDNNYISADSNVFVEPTEKKSFKDFRRL